MDSKSTATVFIETLGEWFNTFPPLSKYWKNILVKYIPIISLIFGILGIIICLSYFDSTYVNPTYILILLLREASGLIPFELGPMDTYIYLIGAILLVAAYPKIKVQKKIGWKLLFWSETINLLAGLVSLHFLAALLWAFIVFYILFQVRSYYEIN